MIAPDRAAGRHAQHATSGRAGDRLSQGRRRQACRLCRRNRRDAIGLDETVDPLWAAQELPEGLPVQGNLDPLALIAGGKSLEDAASASLTPSPGVRTSSISGTGSCRTRRSRMSSS